MKALEKPPQINPEFKLILEAVSNTERFQMMLTLKEHREGVSFSRLASIFRLNNNTLDRHLKVLTKSTLVWNFFERREGKDHSFYKLSTIGDKILEDLKPEVLLTH